MTRLAYVTGFFAGLAATTTITRHALKRLLEEKVNA